LEAVWLPVYIPSEEEKVDPKLYANNVRKLMAVEVNVVSKAFALEDHVCSFENYAPSLDHNCI
jgi:lysophosphatidylcholine acyltransferase/lyso-PAF acetyltransferase